MITLTEVTSLL